MSSRVPVPCVVACIVCEKEVERVDQDSPTQPYGGTSFYSDGQYGSTVFDPMDGQYIHIILCDECLMNRKENVLMGRQARPIRVDGSILGWERVSRAEVLWNPKLSHWDEDEIIEMDMEEALDLADDPRIKWNINPRELNR